MVSFVSGRSNASRDSSIAAVDSAALMERCDALFPELRELFTAG